MPTQQQAVNVVRHLFCTMQLKPFLILVTLSALSSCMTSNKKTFEEFTDINIPGSPTVIHDEYQDMGQDHGKFLELQLNSITKRDLELSITKSKFFNASIYNDANIVDEINLIEFGNKKGLWYRDRTGYSFFGQTISRRDNVTVRIDSTKMVATFHYLSD